MTHAVLLAFNFLVYYLNFDVLCMAYFFDNFLVVIILYDGLHTYLAAACAVYISYYSRVKTACPDHSFASLFFTTSLG